MAVDKFSILTSEEAKEWDRISIQEHKIDSRLLMAWAGYAVFAELRKLKRFQKAREIHFLLGKGNNGGDGYVLAWQILSSSEKKVFLWQAEQPNTEDALYFFDLCNTKKDCIQICPLDQFKISRNQKIVVCDAPLGNRLQGGFRFASTRDI